MLCYVCTSIDGTGKRSLDRFIDPAPHSDIPLPRGQERSIDVRRRRSAANARCVMFTCLHPKDAHGQTYYLTFPTVENFRKYYWLGGIRC